MNKTVRDILLFLLCLACGAVVLAGIVRAAGASPVAVAAALGKGAFGSRYNLVETVIQATPLLLTGLAVAISFRCRLFNIGAEGQLVVGAMAAVAVGTRPLPPSVQLLLCLVAGASAGALWAGIAAVLKIYRGVQEVLSTLLLNFVAVQLLAYAVRGPLQESAKYYPQSDRMNIPARLLLLLPATGDLPATRLHAGVFIALVVTVLIWFYLRFTAGGFALRAVGAGAGAAELAGISVRKTLMKTFLLSGALAGLAGAIQVCGVTYFLGDRFSGGYGYTAIAVALLANLSPGWIVVTALFFGALTAGSSSVQTAGVSPVVIQVMQAVVLFALLAFGYLRGRKGGGGARAGGADA
ncbi:MAG: ABC transporter permease [Akkermansiaceae bacterium]|nr:ABC transporter permease [Armatimonadota bacterium]